jgi:tRNA threonylcarbamoyladenosine biosynthesis protein TsaB
MTENLEKTLILAIDTTSPRSSIAISLGNTVLAQLGIAGNEKRSTNLLSEIDWLLNRVEKTANDITALGVLIGPGSFTGLRVGLATIKGFAHALNRPIVAIKSTEIFARASGYSDCTCVLLDAHRGEVFTQLFAVKSDGKLVELSQIVIAKPENILAEVYEYQQTQDLKGVVFTGDAVAIHKETLLKFAQEKMIPVEQAKLLTANRLGWILQKPQDFLATEVAVYTQEKLLGGETVSASELAAYYVRPAEAEIKLQLGLIGKKKTN